MVFGATGYIGRFVVRELVSRGYQVVAFARERSGSKVTVWTTCNCEHGWHNCACHVELNPEDGTIEGEAYAPPWSHEVPRVFVSDPGDEMKPIEKKGELCDNE